jgi:hypothetical protein
MIKDFSGSKFLIKKPFWGQNSAILANIASEKLTYII